MKRIKSLFCYFTKAEIFLWCVSVLLILISFVLFDRKNFLNLTASLIGVTSLILNAKGNPIGQLLMVVFSLLYGIISFSFAYYGEMITYLGMTAPMAVFALVSWIKNPFNGNKAEVSVNSLTKKDVRISLFWTVVVALIFYAILNRLNTAYILPSTLSVATSFLAVFLTYKRSVLFALAYALNDIVLIVLWILATLEDMSYISVVVCFILFFINDLYGFINWQKMKKRQFVIKNKTT